MPSSMAEPFISVIQPIDFQLCPSIIITIECKSECLCRWLNFFFSCDLAVRFFVSFTCSDRLIQSCLFGKLIEHKRMIIMLTNSLIAFIWTCKCWMVIQHPWQRDNFIIFAIIYALVAVVRFHTYCRFISNTIFHSNCTLISLARPDIQPRHK